MPQGINLNYYKGFWGECKGIFRVLPRFSMKERILSSRLIRWISGLRISRYLGSHRVLGKLFNYEMISYVICGAATTVVNYAVYFLVRAFFRENYGILIAQIVAWIAAVLFAYVVNKIFVFDSPGWDRKTLLREFIPFLTARLLSFGFDTAFMYLTVAVFSWNEPLMKILSNVVVLLANYFASKFIIFKKKKETD